jgi:hypothetical protein
VALQVAEALRERAQRIYDKYGTLMLNIDGMTAEGVERKATCQALFRKLLYLTEHEPLVAAGSEAFVTTDLRLVRAAAAVLYCGPATDCKPASIGRSVCRTWLS